MFFQDKLQTGIWHLQVHHDLASPYLSSLIPHHGTIHSRYSEALFISLPCHTISTLIQLRAHVLCQEISPWFYVRVSAFIYLVKQPDCHSSLKKIPHP